MRRPGLSPPLILAIFGIISVCMEGVLVLGQCAPNATEGANLVQNEYFANYTQGRYWVVEMDGAKEVPPVNTTAVGRGLFVLQGNTFYWDVVHTVENATASHIHGPADENSTAPVIIPFTINPNDTAHIMGSAEISDTFVGYLLAGLTYTNVHSTQHPGGEIRGQLSNSSGDELFVIRNWVCAGLYAVEQGEEYPELRLGGTSRCEQNIGSLDTSKTYRACAELSSDGSWIYVGVRSADRLTEYEAGTASTDDSTQCVTFQVHNDSPITLYIESRGFGEASATDVELVELCDNTSQSE